MQEEVPYFCNKCEEMSKIVFDLELIRIISLFEKVSRARVKDCIIDSNKVLFIVEYGEVAKAVGKKGANIRRMEHLLKRKIKIVEFNSSMLTFIKNLVYPAQIEDMEEQDGTVTIKPADTKSRGMMIGRNASNLRAFESVVQRYFKELQEIKVM